jgi:hypothetical protein
MKLRLIKSFDGAFEIQEQKDSNLEWKSILTVYGSSLAQKAYHKLLRDLRNSKDVKATTTVLQEDIV